MSPDGATRARARTSGRNQSNREVERERSRARAGTLGRWYQRGGRSIEGLSITARTVRSEYARRRRSSDGIGGVTGRVTTASTGRLTGIGTGTGTGMAGFPEQRTPVHGFGRAGGSLETSVMPPSTKSSSGCKSDPESNFFAAVGCKQPALASEGQAQASTARANSGPAAVRKPRLEGRNHIPSWPLR